MQLDLDEQHAVNCASADCLAEPVGGSWGVGGGSGRPEAGTWCGGWPLGGYTILAESQ